ncbi:galanin receptor type 1-like [Patiria miniata]|uniref:G-protein coupled receptors family 1 profile domain-containing protein n=1 Tax=Patiria miniata TaxID=46514 RepID=A0A913YWB1_PATMI|nr:galanin receptor type 1-like [Patiria miniata]
MEENVTNDGAAFPTPSPTLPVLYLREQPLRYAAPSVMSLTLLIGVFGNMCLLYVNLRGLSKRDKSRVVLDVFLASMAVIDLLLLITTGPFFAIEFVLENWPFGGPACRFLLPFNHLTETVGAYTVGALALDECLVIGLPNSYAPRRDLRKSFLANLTIWLTAIVLTIPVTAYTKSAETTYQEFFCTVHMPGSTHGVQLYTFLVSFCIPVVLTLGCLLWILYKSNGNFWRPAKDESQPRSKQTRTTVLLIASLIGAQALLWLPHHITSFVHPGIYSDETTRSDFLSYTAVACYAYANSAIKPILYVFLYEDIRDRFVEAIPYGKGNDIQGIGRGRRLPTTPVRYKHERGSRVGKVPSVTASMHTIHGYPYVIEVNGEDEVGINGMDRRWSM